MSAANDIHSLRDWLAAHGTEKDIEQYIPETTGGCANLFHALGMGPPPTPQDSCRYITHHNVIPKLRCWARYKYADEMLIARNKEATP